MLIKYLTVLSIIFYSTSISSAASFSPADIEWDTAVSGTLYTGNTLTNGEYMVKAVQFSSAVPGYKNFDGNIVPEDPVDPSVLLEIYKNGALIKEIVMNSMSEAYIDPDYEVKVSVTGFLPGNAREWVMEYYKPWAKMAIQKRGKPAFEVTYKLTPDKTNFINGDMVTASVTLKNSGKAFAKNVNVILGTGPLVPWTGDISRLHQNYNRIEQGESKSFEVVLGVPAMLEYQVFNLSTDIKFYDVKDLEYKVTKSTLITTSPRLIKVSKSTKDRVYLKDTSTVRIVVSNSGTFDLHNILINDSLNENFELRSNTTLQWIIPLLKSGTEWSTSYSIRPLEADIKGFVIPAATANFTVNTKLYSTSSMTTTVVVNGPKIIVNKSVNKNPVNISEDVTVSVRIINVGDVATSVEMKDILPDNVNLVSGSLSISPVFLELNSPQGFSYIIRRDTEGEVQLPPAVANYTDVEYKGITRSQIRSDMPVITFIDPSRVTPAPTAGVDTTFIASPALKNMETPQPATTPTSTPYTPGFGSITAFIMLLSAAILKRITENKQKINKINIKKKSW